MKSGASKFRLSGRNLSAAIVAVGLTGCSGNRSIHELTKTGVQQYAIPYQELADCLYPALVEKYRGRVLATISKIDLPSSKEVRLSAISQYVTIWEIRLTGRSFQQTTVEYFGGGSLLFGAIAAPNSFSDAMSHCISKRM